MSSCYGSWLCSERVIQERLRKEEATVPFMTEFPESYSHFCYILFVSSRLLSTVHTQGKGIQALQSSGKNRRICGAIFKYVFSGE